MTQSRLARRLVAALVGAALAVTLTACSAQAAAGSSPASASTSSPSSLPTGTKGAAHLDDGYLEVGTGKTVVDTYIDPQCPFCREFERSSGSSLAALVADGTITLRIHPLTFLDRSSTTQYSTRASSALTCVAADDPSGLLAYLSALYQNQPAEGSAGLPDSTLVSLAHRSGATGADSCITSHAYGDWANAFTDSAISGPIPGANISSITGTPTILVNGKAFGGSFTDNDAVMAFVRSGGKS